MSRPRTSSAGTAPRASTLHDVARAAEVSIASVSRVLNGHDNVTPETRERVLEAVARLRYVPNSGARSLAIRRTNTVGLLLPDLHGEFFSELIRGVDAAARAAGLHLLVSGSHGDMGEAVAVLQAMAGRVDGLLVMSPYVEAGELAAALPPSLPLVTIASPTGGADHSTIMVDNFGGAQAAVRHLAEVGCRRIAHIGGPAQNYEAQERRRGYLAAIAEVAPDAAPQIEEGDFTEQSGYAAVQSWLARGQMPDGLFASNDTMAVGALLALKEAGIRAPQDVAVIGFDDIPIARFMAPPLSTLRTGVYPMGRQALDLLVAALDPETGAEPKHLTISPELVVRESSARRAA